MKPKPGFCRIISSVLILETIIDLFVHLLFYHFIISYHFFCFSAVMRMNNFSLGLIEFFECVC